MGKSKEPEWEFIFDNEPNEEILDEFHKGLAESLISKYGAENMRRVLEVIKSKNE